MFRRCTGVCLGILHLRVCHFWAVRTPTPHRGSIEQNRIPNSGQIHRVTTFPLPLAMRNLRLVERQLLSNPSFKSTCALCIYLSPTTPRPSYRTFSIPARTQRDMFPQASQRWNKRAMPIEGVVYSCDGGPGPLSGRRGYAQKKQKKENNTKKQHGSEDDTHKPMFSFVETDGPNPYFSWSRKIGFHIWKWEHRMIPGPIALVIGFGLVLYFEDDIGKVIFHYFPILQKLKPDPLAKIFDPPRFTPFTIVGREEASPTSIILTVRPSFVLTSHEKPDPDTYKTFWGKGSWSVEVKQPQLQIARSYTPLPPNGDDTYADLRFLIRREHGGEMSGYLHSLPVGSKVELRGPHPEVELGDGITDVVFLAGGTGIAPALQVAHTLLERDLERKGPEVYKPRIQIVWANRRREDCIGGLGGKFYEGKAIEDLDGKQYGYAVRELQMLQQRHPAKFSVDYVVDEEGTFLDQKHISTLTRPDSEVKFGPVTTKIGSKLLFISGPEGFINYFAGRKTWEDGKEGQGELGGVLGRMKLRGWKVWKL